MKEGLLTVLGLVFIIPFFWLALPQEQQITGLFYYGIIFFSVLLAAFAQPSFGDDIKNIPLCFSFFIIYFVLGFRDVSGVDDPTYQKIFEQVNTYGVKVTFLFTFMEPGYLCLCALVGLFTDNYYIFQALASFIPLFFIYKGFVKYHRLIYMPFAILLLCSSLYFQMLSISLVRIFIAISIVFCYSLDALFTSKPKKYVVTIILSASIHYSALIMLLFTPLCFSRQYLVESWKKYSLFLIVISPIVFFIVFQLAGIVGGRYSIYAEQQGNGTLSLATLDSLPFLFFALCFKHIIPKKELNIYSGALVLLLFSVVSSVLTSFFSFGRVVFYMNLSLWFLLPSIFCFSKKNKIVIAEIVIVYSLLYLDVTQFSQAQNVEHLFPYKNIFFTL